MKWFFKKKRKRKGKWEKGSAAEAAAAQGEKYYIIMKNGREKWIGHSLIFIRVYAVLSGYGLG